MSSTFTNLFDPNVSRSSGCSCGGHATQAEHDAAVATDAVMARAQAIGNRNGQSLRTPDRHGDEALVSRTVESTVMRALFPQDATRRDFLRAVGTATAISAVAAAFPLDAAKALASEAAGPLEKTRLRIGFIPITCATPIIMAHPMGFYEKYGLDVDVVKTAGWAVVRDMSLAGEYDAAHMLTPMPLAISLGAGSTAAPWTMPAVENINGQAITLHVKHKDKRDPQQWKGMRFAVPFEFSMHNFLLRYYVAEHGLDPDTDIQIRVLPPPEMVANLRAENVDGYLAPDPFNQRAVFDGVGFIHLLTKEIWDGHPCCAFSASRRFVTENPNTFQALFKAIIEATAYSSNPDNRAEVAKAIAPRAYLNQPETVVAQVLTGTFADGLGNVQRVPDRIDFDPFPWHSMGVWILTQMRRWGYITEDIDYRKVAEEVYLATDAQKLMREMGLTPPEETYKTHTIMGREFDPDEADAYARSFPIGRV
ncbi:MAG: nitrate ABC transporter substrate-binding protein [Rhodospirillales bacterium]|nr:MAG: nitrate ABC transporter substrate-binding protein [Rhodospirillales bacterium]